MNGNDVMVTNQTMEMDLKERNILNLLPAAVYTCDKDGHITFFNDAAVKLWGYTPDVDNDYVRFCACYKVWMMDGTFVSPQETPMAIALRTGEKFRNVEALVERPDGSQFYAAVNIDPVFDANGELQGAVNIFQDITKRKETERALKESEQKYRELASSLEMKMEENAGSLKKKNEELRKSEEHYHRMVEEVEDYAIILMDKEGIIQNWNKGAENIKKYKESEIVGKSFEVFYLKEDRESGLPKRLINEAKEKGKATHEGWRVRKDGTRFWGSILITALHDDDDNVIGFTKVTRDLTERKLAEDQLKEYSNELEFQNRELEQFAYAASHDMKEPLRKIHLYNSYIAEHAGALLDQRSKDYLERSLNSVKRMTGLIEDLLTYSRTTSHTNSFVDVDMNELVHTVIAEHKEDVGEQTVNIEAGSLPVVHGVPFQLKQLMDNLLGNAIKYKHPERKGIVTISSEIVKGAEIKELRYNQNRLYHRISVTDNGIGFDTANAARIFEVFQRLNNVAGERGSGIGLAICKKIVQNHKGFITATGRLNEGARFDIYLPVTS